MPMANSMPRMINVDKNPAYPCAVSELKASGTLSRKCRVRQCKYLNNIVEQDHLFGVKCFSRTTTFILPFFEARV